MTVVFYVSAAIAILSTGAVIVQLNAVHALLYLVLSLLAVALMFFALGAPFVAALEVIIYAGAIIVLFVFVVMLLNLGPQAIEQESRWVSPKVWVSPAILAAILIGELAYVLMSADGPTVGAVAVEPKQVGISLFSTYLLGVELASILLLSALVGAYHLGRRERPAVSVREEQPAPAAEEYEALQPVSDKEHQPVVRE